MKKAFTIAVPVIAMTVLAGCGDSSTATNESTSTPVVASSTSSAAKDSEQSSDTTAKDSPSQAGGEAAAPAPAKPDAPVEVSGVPNADRPANEKAFLSELKQSGIKVDGLIADQVIAAGRRHCEMEQTGSEDLITPAVAGQLVELDATSLTPQQTQDAIVDGARKNFCD